MWSHYIKELSCSFSLLLGVSVFLSIYFVWLLVSLIVNNFAPKDRLSLLTYMESGINIPQYDYIVQYIHPSKY